MARLVQYVQNSLGTSEAACIVAGGHIVHVPTVFRPQLIKIFALSEPHTNQLFHTGSCLMWFKLQWITSQGVHWANRNTSSELPVLKEAPSPRGIFKLLPRKIAWFLTWVSAKHMPSQEEMSITKKQREVLRKQDGTCHRTRGSCLCQSEQHSRLDSQPNVKHFRSWIYIFSIAIISASSTLHGIYWGFI